MPYRITENCRGCGHCVQWCPARAIKGRRRVSYRIDETRCIDCGVCGRICTFAAVLAPDGITAVRMSRLQWSRPHWDYDACTRCDLCISACPVKCVNIADRDDPKTGAVAGYPYLSRSRMCIGCGFCRVDCMDGAIEMKPALIAGRPAGINGSNAL